MIGASSGAIPAPLELGAALPPDLDAMVLMVLHFGAHHSIPPKLMCNRYSLDVAHVVNAEPLDERGIRIAPPDFHLLVERDRLRLSRPEAELQLDVNLRCSSVRRRWHPAD